MVRQVRLELTIPCLRGRCLDPIWLLTRILDCRLPIRQYLCGFMQPPLRSHTTRVDERRAIQLLTQLHGEIH